MAALRDGGLISGASKIGGKHGKSITLMPGNQSHSQVCTGDQDLWARKKSQTHTHNQTRTRNSSGF